MADVRAKADAQAADADAAKDPVQSSGAKAEPSTAEAHKRITALENALKASLAALNKRLHSAFGDKV